jgi:predicted transcriptional regulator
MPAQHFEISVPIGSYRRFAVTPPCGLAGPSSLIGPLDDPEAFYDPARAEAGLLWLHSGWVEYSVAPRLPGGAAMLALELSAEICSDAPAYREDWPSDITLWIGGKEIGTWTCPGDFGGRRGRLTPGWWDVRDTQFGLHKRWRVDRTGASLDGGPLSTVTIDDLAISAEVRIRLGVKEDALHVGGLNLFGRSFGDHPQDLVLRFEHT